MRYCNLAKVHKNSLYYLCNFFYKSEVTHNEKFKDIFKK